MNEEQDERIPHAEAWLIRLRNLIYKAGIAPELAIYVFMAERGWKRPSRPSKERG